MDALGAVQEANAAVLAGARTLIESGFAEGDADVFADDVVFHYVNPYLPELDGDHHGVEGVKRFFERMTAGNEAGFRVEPASLTPHGEELVVACVTNTVGLQDGVIEVDAVVVWRVVDERVQEVWDIPAVNTIRTHPSDPG
ncbi:MAG: nuclear transport factor 2 family protein [Actinomycetota bacterium]